MLAAEELLLLLTVQLDLYTCLLKIFNDLKNEIQKSIAVYYHYHRHKYNCLTAQMVNEPKNKQVVGSISGSSTCLKSKTGFTQLRGNKLGSYFIEK